MERSFDVAIAGAGSAGAAAAAFCAERGLSVVVLERRPLAEAGARWVNGVPRAAFVDTGVALPGPDESVGEPPPFHLVAGRTHVVVPQHDILDVDMRRLVARLQARAAAAGATLRDGVTVHGLDGDALRTSAGAVRARWFVDAGGLAGPRLLDQPAPPRDRLCAAAQEVREVVDVGAARAWFAARGVPPGEVLGMVGVAGGFSVVNLRLHPGDRTVGILTGSIPALGFPSGRALLDQVVAEHAWIGARIYGGGGAIPLGRAHPRLAGDRVALLGDAAAQVFPAHGSGVGAGMRAARLLADTLAAGRPLRDYEVGWHRSQGGLHATFEVFRRWSQDLDEDGLARLLALGLGGDAALRAGLDQAYPALSPPALAGSLRRLAADPGLARAVLDVGVRAALVRAAHARYPRRAAAVPAWSRLVARLAGDRARAWQVREPGSTRDGPLAG